MRSFQNLARSSEVVIILGAGPPFSGVAPAPLIETPDHRQVLDWIVEAYSKCQLTEIIFVGGYHLEEIAKDFPNLTCILNPEWNTTSNATSIFTCPLKINKTHYINYADIVFRENIVKRVQTADADIVLAVDGKWRERYSFRSNADLTIAEKMCIDAKGEICAIGKDLQISEANAEFVGLVKFSPKAMEQVLFFKNQVLQGKEPATLFDLIGQLLSRDLSVKTVDCEGDWAELNTPQDLAQFVLGTKAETLERLRPLVRRSHIEEQVCFTAGEWQDSSSVILDELTSSFGEELLIIRSSSLGEDSWDKSEAGKFLSIPNVKADNRDILLKSISKVVSSYKNTNSGHQILVQKMISDVALSGVIFARTLSYGAPYYTINYDAVTFKSDTVTDGSGQHLDTLIIFRNWEKLPSGSHPLLSKLLGAIQELEKLVGHNSLDIEFAISRDGKINILQLRPITLDHSKRFSDEQFSDLLSTARKQFLELQRPGPPIFGEKTFFGVMPDWNPAEIIGIKPRQLALSLYRYLITDEVWAIQRSQSGYRNVFPQPLLRVFAGHPYIDIRASFNSFIPSKLPNALAEKLVTYYLQRLEDHPHLHDKIEFDIVFTCLDLDFDKQSNLLRIANFDENEIGSIRHSLRKITCNAVSTYKTYSDNIALMEKRYLLTMNSTLSPLNRAIALLEDCRVYGTLPFAHLARSAFIAMALLKSMVSKGILSNHQSECFLNSLQTVGKGMQIEAENVIAGKMSWEDFVKTYGHLRPGTYEITSTSYLEDTEFYLRPLLSRENIDISKITEPFNLKKEVNADITKCLKKMGFAFDLETLESFMRETIEGREYAKFVFSRNLSKALDCFVEFGLDYNLSREQLSHLEFEDLRVAATEIPASQVSQWFLEKSEKGSLQHELTQAIELPPVLFDVDDLFSFQLPKSQPNFVGRGMVIAQTFDLENGILKDADLCGKIIFIPQADPGYDWLFGKQIAGLITMYGGPNSHMAIRTAELGLPAAIGIGKSEYKRILHACVIELNCADRCLRIIQ
jgi:glutamine kinase